jgi:hypothetical protein
MTDNGAFQALTSASKIPLPDGTKRVRIQNLGAAVIYLGSTAAKCTAALGLQVAATAGFTEFDVAGHELYAIAPSGNQSTPADTRWYVIG